MYNKFLSEGNGNTLLMTEVLPNPFEGITNDLERYSKMKSMITI